MEIKAQVMKNATEAQQSVGAPSGCKALPAHRYPGASIACCRCPRRTSNTPCVLCAWATRMCCSINPYGRPMK